MSSLYDKCPLRRTLYDSLYDDTVYDDLYDDLYDSGVAWCDCTGSGLHMLCRDCLATVSDPDARRKRLQFVTRLHPVARGVTTGKQHPEG